MLTPRQRQIAELVAQGMTNKAISQHTGLALPTVKEYVSTAASRLPGDGRPRFKLIVFVLSEEEPGAA